jgi:hypothetical protein
MPLWLLQVALDYIEALVLILIWTHTVCSYLTHHIVLAMDPADVKICSLMCCHSSGKNMMQARALMSHFYIMYYTMWKKAHDALIGVDMPMNMLCSLSLAVVVVFYPAKSIRRVL